MRIGARVSVVVLAAGLAALAAGCGGGGKNNPNPPTTGATSTQQGTTGGGGTSFASAKNCRQFAGLAAKIASAISATSGNPATALQTESQQLQTLASAAPSGIRGDFQTFATAFSSYLTALEKAGFKPGASSSSAPSAAQIAALTSAAKVFSSAKLTAAEAHLSSWAASNCT
jgi:hypothetical protein